MLAQDMSTMSEFRPIILAMLVALLGIIGIGLIVLLGIAWRRFNSRHAHQRAKEKDIDIWQEGGDRLVAQIDDQKRQQERTRHLHHRNDDDQRDETNPPEDDDEPHAPPGR